MTAPAGASGAALTRVSRALHSVRYTSSRILRHPANRRRRARAIGLYVAWQVWERVVRRPWTIRLGDVRRLKLYPHSVVAAFVLYYRVHDYEEMSFMRAYLRPGDLFVDIGANIGVYSLWASQTEGVEVLAFEPSTATHARAIENVELNRLGHRIRVLRKAVGAREAQVRVTTGRDAVNKVASNEDGIVGTESVAQTTLDAELGPRVPALIKMDVEGGELDVLRGGRTCITTHHPALLIEVNDPEGLVAMLDDIGYGMWSYDPEQRLLTPVEPVLGTNVLALADVEKARERLVHR